MNLSASTGSLVAITVERYRAICLPFTPPLSKFQAKLTIAVVSLASFLVALPEVGAYTLGPPFGCVEIFPSLQLRKAYTLLLFLACYLLPLLFIAPAYTRMIYKLWNDRDENSPGSGVSEDPKNHKRKRNVLKMMVIVVLCYAICMMPTYAMFLWLDFGLTGITGHTTIVIAIPVSLRLGGGEEVMTVTMVTTFITTAFTDASIFSNNKMDVRTYVPRGGTRSIHDRGSDVFFLG